MPYFKYTKLKFQLHSKPLESQTAGAGATPLYIKQIPKQTHISPYEVK